MFQLTNDGAEVHEIAVAHIKTNTPIKKLLSDEKRADKETVFLGGSGPVAEGDTLLHVHGAHQGSGGGGVLHPGRHHRHQQHRRRRSRTRPTGMVREFKVS